MKGGEKNGDHSVHLTPRAVEIVKGMRELKQPYAFASPSLDGKPLSNMAMLTLLRRMGRAKATTVHGICRASFSTWAYENSAARPDAIECALPHREADGVKAAYNRATFTQQRVALLQAWSDFLDGKQPADNVVELKIAAA